MRPFHAVALTLLALSLGCIERSASDDADPTADAALADAALADAEATGGCEPEECADLPPIACQDGNARACVELADGRCALECPPPPPPRMCTPDACGDRPVIDCPADTRPVYACPAEQAGFDCLWQVDCAPVGRPGCSPDDCGPIPPGEACPPGTRGVSECRLERDMCTWYLDCEPIGCQPEDCGPADYPEPDCDFVAECVTTNDACAWRLTCTSETCDLAFDPGPCPGDEPVWWFNAAENRCEERSHGGCEGNLNRFETEEACLNRCQLIPGK